MTITLIGQITTSRGKCQSHDANGDPKPYTLPARAFKRQQPYPLPVHLDHDETWTIGHVVGLHRSEANGLLMVATIPDDNLASLLDDYEWYLSSGALARDAAATISRELSPALAGLVDPFEVAQVLMTEVSLVPRPAAIGTRPVYWTSVRGGRPHSLPVAWDDTWAAAQESITRAKYRMAPKLLEIIDADKPDLIDQFLSDPATARQQVADATASRRRATPARPVPTTQQTSEVVYRHHVGGTVTGYR